MLALSMMLHSNASGPSQPLPPDAQSGSLIRAGLLEHAHALQGTMGGRA